MYSEEGNGKARDIAKSIFDMLKGRSDDLVVNLNEVHTTFIKIYEGRSESVVSTDEVFASVFVAKEKRVLVTLISDFSDSALRKKEKEIIDMLHYVERKEDYYGIAEGKFRYGKERNFDKKLWDLDSKAINDGIDKAVASASRNGASKVHGMLSISNSKGYLRTSGGVEASEKATSIKLSLRTFGENGAACQAVGASRHLKKLDFEKIGKEASAFLYAANSESKLENGEYDVIYMPLAAGELIAGVGDAASIGSVESGFSFLARKQGKLVASKQVSIFDDPTIEDGLNSYLFDEEGVPSRRTSIIENGVLKSYLHNTSTARKYKTKSTGNAGLPDPQPSNIVLEHKKSYASLDKLIASVDKGVLVTNTWYTRFKNYETGEFSTVPRDSAFLINKGSIEKSIKNIGKESVGIGIRISDSMERMLKNMRAAGGKTVQETGWDEPSPVFIKPVVVEKVGITAARW
ncbi:MAG: TldD/PmbA family protein [Candidatus Micrarchaeia archaeon]